MSVVAYRLAPSLQLAPTTVAAVAGEGAGVAVVAAAVSGVVVAAAVSGEGGVGVEAGEGGAAVLVAAGAAVGTEFGLQCVVFALRQAEWGVVCSCWVQ